jgi:hypothetical protein
VMESSQAPAFRPAKRCQAGIPLYQ